MRLPVLFAALFVAVPAGFYAGAASAQFADQDILFGRRHVYQGAWCAHNTSAIDNVEEDCSFDTFRSCQRSLGSANFGFCTQNPGYRGPPPRPAPRKKKPRRQN